ncbi:MAG: hypothetical protein JW784_00430 [Candidatus Cloacimonetes bacterium]|nr:hypothetical protein [Candidatus Cloacimonadota bacterium]
MKETSFTPVLFSIILLFLNPALSAALDDYDLYYQVQVGDKYFQDRYLLQKLPDHWLRTFITGSETTVTCNDSTRTLRMTVQDSLADTDLMIVRQNNYLVITGRQLGKQVNKNLKIDDRPWFQAISHSLYDFVKSEDSEIEFWFLLVDGLQAYKLKALKAGLETITLDGREYETCKVKVTLKGILSALWSSYYWYRATDGLFVQYKGRNGPPGTPYTIVRLLN